MWRECGGTQKSQPPPVAFVWNPKRIHEKRGWFAECEPDYMGGSSVIPDEVRILHRLWLRVTAAVDHATTDAERRRRNRTRDSRRYLGSGRGRREESGQGRVGRHARPLHGRCVPVGIGNQQTIVITMGGHGFGAPGEVTRILVGDTVRKVRILDACTVVVLPNFWLIRWVRIVLATARNRRRAHPFTIGGFDVAEEASYWLDPEF